MLKHLRSPEQPPGERSLFKSTDLTILDPCAGEGEALQILSEGLALLPDHVHAVELHAERAAAVARRMPQARVLGPCGFAGTNISPKSFSIVYVNPPFDYDGSGTGTREEQNFVRQAYELLAPNGVLVLVCPHGALIGNSQFASMVDSMFEHVEVYRFPEGHAPYKELCVFGTRRPQQIDAYTTRTQGDLGKRGFHGYMAKGECPHELFPQLGELQPIDWKRELVDQRNWRYTFKAVGQRETVDTWTLPYAWAPRRWAKSMLTEEERLAGLKSSPLWAQLREPTAYVEGEPWLRPAKGHTIMLIVSGKLDGLVPSNPPHVARGFFVKKEKENPARRTATENSDTGAVTETLVFQQETVFCVRAVEVDEFGTPRIHEYSSDSDEGEEMLDEGD